MNNWKDKIMNSLEGMEPVQPPEHAFQNIQKAIAKQENSQNAIERIQRLAVAAAIVLTISANIFFITDYYNNNSEPPTESVDTYPQVITSFNIYSP